MRSRYASLLCLSLMLLFAVPTAAATVPAAKVKHTSGWVQTVAMSGSNVGYSIGGGLLYGPGDRVYVWNVRTGAVRLVSAYNSNPVYEIAMAGKRLAWIARSDAGDSRYQEIKESLFTTSLTSPRRARPLATANRAEASAEPGPPPTPYSYEGDWIGGLAGSGSTLAVSRWSTTGPGTLTTAELDTIGSTGLRARVMGESAIVSESTDGGRMAVLRSTDAWPIAGQLAGKTSHPSVGIYSAGGKLLRQIDAGSPRQIALSGSELVVLSTAPRKLKVYNWRSGRLVHTWRLPNVGRVHLEDVHGQIAVYSISSQGLNLHLLQLTTGKDVLLTKGPGLLPYDRGRDAQLEAPGLVYAVDRPGSKEAGKLVFVPMARVLAAVSKGHVR